MKDLVIVKGLYRRIVHLAGECGVQPVVLDDHRHHITTAGVGSWLHRHDGAGNGSMHRHAQSLAVTDLLSPFYGVTHLHQRRTGRADVLLHGNDHFLGDDGLQT